MLHNKVLELQTLINKGSTMQLLSLIESIAAHVNAQNIEQFISLVEKLVALAESVKQPNNSSANVS
jgi:hypothetical protein